MYSSNTTHVQPVPYKAPIDLRLLRIVELVQKLGRLYIPLSDSWFLRLTDEFGVVRAEATEQGKARKLRIFTLDNEGKMSLSDRRHRESFPYLQRSEAWQALQKLEADPYSTATTMGKLTGTCCICGKLLTDPASVAAGIGPVCASNFNLALTPEFNLEELLNDE